MRAEGTLGPLTPFFDLPFPLLVGVLDLFLSVAGALLDELALLADPGKGNKWKATVGWIKTLGRRVSSGSSPMAFLFNVVNRSDMYRKAALSALRICCTDTGDRLFPLGRPAVLDSLCPTIAH